MKYLVSDIPEGYAQGHNHLFSELPEDLGFTKNEINIESNIAGKFKLWREGSLITMQGNIFATAVMECCRCLATTTTSVHPAMTLRCIPKTSISHDVRASGEVTPEDDIYTYDGIALDIRPIIREQIILSVPEYLYCRSDCVGGFVRRVGRI